MGYGQIDGGEVCAGLSSDGGVFGLDLAGEEGLAFVGGSGVIIIAIAIAIEGWGWVSEVDQAF